jgi:hypothetical protein
VDEVEEDTYTRRANRIRIQHRHGQIVERIRCQSSCRPRHPGA